MRIKRIGELTVNVRQGDMNATQTVPLTEGWVGVLTAELDGLERLVGEMQADLEYIAGFQGSMTAEQYAVIARRAKATLAKLKQE